MCIFLVSRRIERGNGGAKKPRRPYKKGIERDKKARTFHLNNWPACPIGDFSDRKRPQSSQKACRHSCNKDRSDGNKGRNFCPYGRNALKANKKARDKGPSLSVTSKVDQNRVTKKDNRRRNRQTGLSRPFTTTPRTRRPRGLADGHRQKTSLRGG